MPYRIYLVEDEQNLNELLATYLRNEGWDVTSFLNGGDARRAIAKQPDLWILDIMIPDVDGYQLIREIKAQAPDVPVIFISARDAELDRVIGLEMGSDDYLPKPFLPRELVIRVKRLLGRIYNAAPLVAEAGNVLHIAPYTIDETKRVVTQDNKEVELTSKEFDLLLLYAKNQGQAFAREQILRRIWGEDYFGTDRVVDDLIRRVRKKMPELRIETIYGYGYRMVQL
ncbi:two-component system response regulator CssR [Aneurinibacillus soli]|uniref:Transcriptional regulatory protein CssR n=1 Tax=Aneurinibacillus soli TaxID=1500254 RepID=A0A0U4WGP4_9BACL|nr:response regulator transcription factor [Aneurinibacillus soli]PYE61323.1 two-component system response regulator CssR [Aneurinibacillus soli]BAU27848.1 Transcriptional regulatory protein CssR [Aneurinibacillus soli]